MWREIKPKMREKERIKRICSLIEKIWMKYPDQRLGQLFINNHIFRDSLAVWIEEDYDLERHLKYVLDEMEKKENK